MIVLNPAESSIARQSEVTKMTNHSSSWIICYIYKLLLRTATKTFPLAPTNKLFTYFMMSVSALSRTGVFHHRKKVPPYSAAEEKTSLKCQNCFIMINWDNSDVSLIRLSLWCHITCEDTVVPSITQARHWLL